MIANLSICKELYYLVTIAEEGSLTKASQKLYVAQPSLSFFLKEMERKIGIRLFSRVKTGLVPTAAGEIILSTAKKMLEDWETALDTIQTTSKIDSYVFATPAFRGTIILPSIMVNLQGFLPEIIFDFTEILTSNIPIAFEENRIHAAFMVNQKMNGDQYINRKIIDEEIFLVGHSSHPMYRDAYENNGLLRIDPKMLNDYDVIVLQPIHQIYRKVSNYFQENDIHPRKLIETSNMMTSIKMAESGIGITFLPAMFLLQCNCTPVSIGQSGLRWPVYLTTHQNSNSLIATALFNSIQKTYRSILLPYA